MSIYNNAPIKPAKFSWSRNQNIEDLKVSDWVQPVWETEANKNTDWDVVLIGAPLSRSSISVSGASEFPDYFRRSWDKFSTYNIDEDLDLRALSIADLGDVMMHYTEILQSHRNIHDVMTEVCRRFPTSFPITIGGDHSITAQTVKGMKAAFPDKTIGILQFDTHLDLRSTEEHGPTNGTPIRQLLEVGVVKGRHVHNLGLHGFFNAPSLIKAAKIYEVQYIPLGHIRKQGIRETVTASLEKLQKEVDLIYVTVDIDVLDIAYAQGVPASTPGGMRTDELFAALSEVGKCSAVKAIDFVCIDPTKDTPAMATVKTTTYAVLTFLTSYLRSRKFSS
ncbi:agmatinase family protein [Bacillus sp. B15-48]|uniref:agmatinase family protein n=1 Tax=Bacillus sp. B15-48 TaxID=1548601 RepID=UPI00193F3646|nr:agmatinase family protein [Bacillus sp. B15-48]MBM4761070.1 formimidoylglutamase [Bacillus sp. B15-48]